MKSTPGLDVLHASWTHPTYLGGAKWGFLTEPTSITLLVVSGESDLVTRPGAGMGMTVTLVSPGFASRFKMTGISISSKFARPDSN